MTEYKRLLELLRAELAQQERLLELLTSERAAIVKLNQDQLDKLAGEKEQILTKARKLEGERSMLMEDLTGEEPGKAKFSRVLESCRQSDTKRGLGRVAEELRGTATQVQELNAHNTLLLKQALGLVASTIAIFRSAPGTELPTYSGAGTLRGKDEPTLPRSSSINRSA